MSTEEFCVTLGLLLGGVVIAVIGVWRRLGKSRAWYLVPNNYVLLPKGTTYAMPVGGLMLILLGVGILINDPEIALQILIWVILPLMGASYLIIVFEPRWFKPKWVLWLEDNHGDILILLLKEARESPPMWRHWARQVSTQEGLETWVADVRRKHGLDKKKRGRPTR